MVEDFEDTFDSIIERIIKKEDSFKLIIKLALESQDESCFIAGGIVRDSFLKLNSEIKDVDLFVTSNYFMKLKSVIEKKGKFVINPYGSARWFPANNSLFYYDIIIIENFFNGLWDCENIIDVLNQFDITANAVAFDLKTKIFFNPNNGYLHIKRKELRAIRFDYPELNISSDIHLSRNSVLWFRYRYYAKKLDFRIDTITKSWIEENSHRIKDKELFTKYFFNPDIHGATS